MSDFTKRIKSVKAKTGLTIKEMSVWFDDMSDQTMWSWLQGRVPKPYHRERAEELLELLEKELSKKSSAFPIALSIRQGERQKYVAGIRKRYA